MSAAATNQTITRKLATNATAGWVEHDLLPVIYFESKTQTVNHLA